MKMLKVDVLVVLGLIEYFGIVVKEWSCVIVGVYFDVLIVCC